MTYKTDISLNGWKQRIKLINPTIMFSRESAHAIIQIDDFTANCFVNFENNLILFEKDYQIGKYPDTYKNIKKYSSIKLPKEWKKRIMIDLELIKV